MLIPHLAILTGSEMAIAAAAAFLPFLFSFISALRPDSKPRGVEDYFLYERTVDTGTFATGSVGYSMQVASIYLFLYWFPKYGFWSLVVPVAWFGGYLLQALLVKTGRLDKFLGTDKGHIATIHGFIGSKLGDYRLLIGILAATTVVGFGGTMLAEIDYALTYFVLPGLGVSVESLTAQTILFLIVFLAAGSYIMWGGYRAALDTDASQVKAAFLLFAAILGAFGLGAAKSGNSSAALIVCSGLVGFALVAIASRRRLRNIDLGYKAPWKDIALFWGMIVIAGGSIAKILWATPLSTKPVSSYSSGLSFGFGFWGMIALLFTNLLWQFLDVSSLQRLQSLQYDSTNPDDKKKVWNALIAAGWEGTGSWFIVIAFAILLKACGVDTTSPHLGMLNNVWLLALFLYVVVAFMLSTLDMLVAASAYVVHYDFTRRFFRANSTEIEGAELQMARRATMAVLLATSILYFSIKWAYAENPDRQSAIVYAIYAIQASIFGPVVVSVLWPQRVNILCTFLAIVAGWVAGLVVALSQDPWFGLPLDSWYVMPPFAALVASLFLAVLGTAFRPHNRCED